MVAFPIIRRQGCRNAVQWRVVTEVFIDERTILDLCGDDDLMVELDLPRKSSVSTRCRRLGEQLKLAFAGLQRCLESRNLWSAD